MANKRKFLKVFLFLFLGLAGSVAAYVILTGSSIGVPPIAGDNKLVVCDVQIMNPINPLDHLRFKSVVCNVPSTGCIFPFSMFDQPLAFAASGKVIMHDAAGKSLASTNYVVDLHADTTVSVKACVGKEVGAVAVDLYDSSNNKIDSSNQVVG